MDQLEERSLLLKQHLREAEIEVAHKRGSLDALDDERRGLADEGRRLEAEVSRLDEDVEIARSGDDPSLARFAIRRWLPQRNALRELFDQAQQLDQRRARLADKLECQEVDLAALRLRVRCALARPSPEPLTEPAECVVTDEEVELELARRRERPADVAAEQGDRS
jgi:phage shock protein A